MPSFKSVVFAVAAAFVAVAQADYTINPDTVPLSKRQSWCQDEKRTCPIICLQTPPGTTLVNECDPATLTYGCICGDGKQPNVSEYTLTLPYYVCTEWGTQCVAACADNMCASACREEHPCGASSPQRQNASTTTASATASQTSGQIFTGVIGAPDKSFAPGTFDVARAYGLLVVVGGLFAGFGLLL